MPAGPDFVPWMQSEVAKWADSYGVDSRRAFPNWCLGFLFEVDDDDAFNQTDTLTQGDAGLDGWHFDRNAEVFHLLQAKYLDNPNTGQVSPGDLDPLIRAALLLQNPAMIEAGPHRQKLTAIALELQQALLDDVAVSLDFMVAGSVSSGAKLELEQAIATLGPNFTATFYDLQRLYGAKLEDELIEDLTGQSVDFRLSENAAHYQTSVTFPVGVEKLGVATVDGRSLADAVAQWGPRLFHSNVRYYLRRTNRVNKEMLKTLDDPSGQSAFLLYNNGITIVAESFEVETTDDGSLLRVVNPQIVNGAQTSSVLSERRAHLAHGDVAVQVRIISVTGDAAGRDALEKISEYTNSQSPVKPGDLRSNDRRHRTMQSAFGMLTPPVFYERRRGEWMSLTQAARAKYQSRRVSKEEIGQTYLAFIGRPADSVVRKESIFGDLEAEAFNTAVSAQVYLLATTLQRQATDLMKRATRQN